MYGLLVPLLVFLPGILSAALVIDLITEEYQHGTLETLISTPVTFAEMVWGKVLTCTVIVPVRREHGSFSSPPTGWRSPTPFSSCSTSPSGPCS